MTPLLIALAGGAGAWCRFRLDGLIKARLHGGVGAGTLVINVTGSFLLGVLVGWLGAHGGWADARTVLGTGFLGGYTTFSTAAVELTRLTREGRTRTALVIAFAMLALGLAAAVAGLALGGLA